MRYKQITQFRPEDHTKYFFNLLTKGDFAVPAGNRVRVNDIEKRDKYMDFAGEL